MSKKEYLARLEQCLAGISPEERQAAMEYYTDYLEDAGPEGEQAAMEQLGTPEKVAAAIAEGIRGEGSGGDWTERGYETEPPFRDVPDSRNHIQKRERRKKGIIGLILLVIVWIFCGIPIFATVASVAFSVIAALAALCFGGLAVVLALVLAGLVLLGTGSIKIAAVPGIGAMLSGIGLRCLALALALLPVCLWIVRTVIPKIMTGISWIFHRMFGKGGRRK